MIGALRNSRFYKLLMRLMHVMMFFVDNIFRNDVFYYRGHHHGNCIILFKREF